MRLTTASLVVVALISTVWTMCGDEVAVGDSSERAREVLGPPEGYIKSGTYELLVYDRGRVEVRDGAVIKVSLVTKEEAAAAREEKERLRLARIEAEMRRREELIREGERVRDATLADPAFLARSAAEQIAYWEAFKRNYPGVQPDSVYRAELLARHAKEVREDETRQRLLEMERRVAAAEARAEQAERDAEESRRRSRSYTDYGYSYTTYPVVRHGLPYVVAPTSRCDSRPVVRTPSTVVGPCTGRPIQPGRTPYVWRPNYLGLGCSSTPSYTGKRIGTQVRAKVSF